LTRAIYPARSLGRYTLLEPFASGGMAAVHFGRQLGPAGIARIVAIKRLHPHLVCEDAFVKMFLDEARLAMRIRHPNVVPVLDVIAENGELFIVMEYVAGLALVRLHPRATFERIPPSIASAIVTDALLGLQSAHAATNEAGEPLGLVHRDVSPHNILVGSDGISRVIDFGIAKAAGRAYATPTPEIKGKLGYMAPEQLSTGPVSPRSDVYSVSVMLWECLTGRKLIRAGDDRAAVDRILNGDFDPPSLSTPEIGAELDAVVMKGLARDPGARWASAQEMAGALEAALPRASALRVAAWMDERAGTALADMAAQVRALEASPVARPMVVCPVDPTGQLPAHPGHSSVPPPTTTSARHRDRPTRLWVTGMAACAATIGAIVVPYVASRRRPRDDVVAVDSTWRAPEPTPPPSAPLVDSLGSPSWPPPVASIKRAAVPVRPASNAAVAKSNLSSFDASPKHDEACRVPFVIDDEGRRHYNRSCLSP
jgi:hypothetical protein